MTGQTCALPISKSSYLLSNLRTDQSVDSVREALISISADYAYWHNLLSEVNAKIRSVEAEYDYWYAEKYSWQEEIPGKKTTESFKKNAIILDNAAEWKLKLSKKSALYLTRDKITGLLKSLDMQSRVLQTVAALIRAEMGIVKTE